MQNKFIKILIAIIFTAFPLISFAQLNTVGSFNLAGELGVEMVPDYPRPNENVSISLTLYTDDLNSATITWYKDGQNVLSGKGETRYSFRAGSVGTATNIEIKVDLLSGASFSKTITLNPVSVDLTWEANSYVPPFYKGKALHPRQGSLKVVASPEFVKGGRRISAQNLNYEWSNGLDVYQSQSGYGKNTIVLDGSLLGKQENIKVLVTDPVNSLVAQSFINIAPTNPQIIFYENSPYYGHIFEKNISNVFDLKSEEVQVVAAPYYFTKESNDGLKYSWRLNNRAVPELDDSRTAIFKKPEGENGQSRLSLNIENLNRVLQQGSANLTIKFDE